MRLVCTVGAERRAAGIALFHGYAIKLRRIFSSLFATPPPAAEAAESDSLLRQLLAGALLVSALVGAIVAVTLVKGYQQRLEQASITVENLSMVLEESLFGSVSLIDHALLAVADEATRQVAAGGIDRPALNAFIDRQNARLPRSDGLRATNAQGSTQYGVGVIPGAANAVGRDYFIALQSNPKAGLVLSKPLIGRMSGKWAVIFARRHELPDGSFDGVVFLPINLETFAKDFSAIDIGAHGLIALLGENADIIVRKPEPQGFGSTVGKHIVSPKIQELVRSGVKTGVYSSRSPVDGVERLLSARKVGNYPLYIVVGLDSQDYLAGWRRDAIILTGSWLVFTVLLLLLSILVARSWRQRFTTLKTLALNRELEAKVAERTCALKESNRKLEALSATDGLTGISNRRAFDLAMAEEWGCAARLGQSIALIILDVDLFKYYNDHYGHVQGDDCLRKVAQLLNATAQRAGDMVARYGGEEFVVLLPGSDAASAMHMAISICKALENMALPHLLSPYQVVTISAGVAASSPGATDSAQALVEMADQALYMAKKQGRNQAVLANGDATTQAAVP